MCAKIRTVGTLLLISLLLEVFLFNSRSFELIGRHSSEEIRVLPSEMTESDKDGRRSSSFRIDDPTRVPQNLRSVQLDFEIPPTDILRGQIHTEEEGSLSGHSREIKIIPAVEHSRNIFLYPSARVTAVTFTLETEAPSAIRIVFNQPLPIRVNGWRLLILFLALGLLYLLRPGSPLYRIRFDLRDRRQQAAFLILFLSYCGFLIWTAISTYPDLETMLRSDNFAFWNKDHYQLLTEALKSRSVSLAAEPPAALETLRNPYDGEERLQNGISDADIYWDTAYFGGKYYVYFGVVPVVTLLLPFRLLTGRYLLNDFAVLAYAIIGSLGLLCCYFWFLRRYFLQLSAPMAWIGAAILLNSAGLAWCVRRPLSYELAVTAAFCFSVCGLALNLSALDQGRFRRAKLFVGCLLMAAAVGCRPTALFVSLLNLPVLPPLLFGRKDDHRLTVDFGALLSAAVPYVLVVAGLMSYNFVRFDSVLEFGQNYQLTIVDNRAVSSGPLLSNVALGIYNLVFRGGTMLSTDFPFLVPSAPLTFGFVGTKFWKDSFSVAAICPLVYLLLFPYFRTGVRQRGKQFRGIFWALVAVPLLMAAFVGTTVGTYQRYVIDFAWMLVLAGLLAAFLCAERLAAAGLEQLTQGGLVICLMINTAFAVVLSCGEAQLGVKNFFEFHNPVLFNQVAYQWMFWL